MSIEHTSSDCLRRASRAREPIDGDCLREAEALSYWENVCLVDGLGAGSDLAFTQGLEALDLPELLLWARPTEGDDPGADWLLTPRERGRLLDRWALQMFTGGPAATQQELFDGGHTVASFRFPSPTLSEPGIHPNLAPGTPVIAVAWSLHRAAAVEPQPMRPAAARNVERWIATAQAAAWAPVGPLPPADPDRFGPLTRLVHARITQVLAADAAVLAEFVGRRQLAEHARCEDCLLETLTRHATRARRNTACREAAREAQELALMVIGHPQDAISIWGEAVEIVLGREPAGDEADRQRLKQHLRVMLFDGLETLLLSAVLADVVPSSVTASGVGAWEWAWSAGRVPGRPWLAQAKVRRAARRMLDQAGPEEVMAAVLTAAELDRLPDYRDLAVRLTGIQTTSPASPQPGSLFRRDQRRGLPRAIHRLSDQLAGRLVTAMAVPQQLSAHEWQLLRTVLAPVAPGLPQQLPIEVW